ncbi:L-lactate permease [Shigella flexneri]
MAFGAMGIPFWLLVRSPGLIASTSARWWAAASAVPDHYRVVPGSWIMDGWRGVKETWPAVMVAGGSFAIAQYLSSNFLGLELPDIISSSVSLVCLTLSPQVLAAGTHFPLRRYGRFAGRYEPVTHSLHRRQAGSRLSPFLFLTATVTLWSIPPLKHSFAPGGALYDL